MEIDWSNKNWAYMLGVIHGDGHIAKRSIEISVGYRDADYMEIIRDLWRELGFSPKLYRPRSALRIDVNSKDLTETIRPLKAKMKWYWPANLDWSSYLAGVIDTDGCVTKNKQIVVVLKRSGNLSRLGEQLTNLGVRPLRATNTSSVYNGAPYLTERLAITGMDRLRVIGEQIMLRHPRKQARLEVMLARIREIQGRIPVWRQIGLWIQQEGPKTWREIAEKFRLSQVQVNSALGTIRKSGTLETIPQDVLFRVNGL